MINELRHKFMKSLRIAAGPTLFLTALLSLPLRADDAPREGKLIVRPGLFESLTEPPCSYCSTENRKGFIAPNERVIAWVRGQHNGGAIPLRHFIAASRVINDTYGLF